MRPLVHNNYSTGNNMFPGIKRWDTTSISFERHAANFSSTRTSIPINKDALFGTTRECSRKGIWHWIVSCVQGSANISRPNRQFWNYLESPFIKTFHETTVDGLTSWNFNHLLVLRSLINNKLLCKIKNDSSLNNLSSPDSVKSVCIGEKVAQTEITTERTIDLNSRTKNILKNDNPQYKT